MAQEAVIEHENRRNNEHRQSNVFNPPRRFVYRQLKKEENDEESMETKTLSIGQNEEMKPPSPCNAIPPPPLSSFPAPPQRPSSNSTNGAIYYPQPWQPQVFFDPNYGFLFYWNILQEHFSGT